MIEVHINPFEITKEVNIGFQYDHKAYKVIFDGLEEDNYYLKLQDRATYQAFPIPNLEWIVTSTYTQQTLLTAQIFRKVDDELITHTPKFRMSLKSSLPQSDKIKEVVPPNFQTAYDEIVETTDEIERKLENGEFNGKDGTNGKSAYEIAVENGFEGTEQEWLESLDYEHSEEFTQLANQVREDAEKSSQALELTNQNKSDVEKLVSDFNVDYDSKLQSFNTNATEKTEAFNENVSNATNAFNSAVQEANTQIDLKVQEATEQSEKAKQEADRATQATDGKLDKNQGTDNVGKVMVVGEDGELIPTEYKSGSDNKLIGTVIKSENLSVSDSYNTELMNLKFYGKSAQVTTTGANIFNPSNNQKGYYTGTEGSPVTLNTGVGWSWEGELPSNLTGQYTFSLTTTVKVRWRYYVVGSDGLILSLYEDSSANNSYNKKTFEMSEGATKVYFSILEITGADQAQIMLNEGSSALPYEPYTGGQPSPSPEYPQEITAIEQVSGSVVGKNLFDVSNIETIVTALINNNDGSITVTASSGDSAINSRKTLDELTNGLLKVGNTYTLSFISTGSTKSIYLKTSLFGWNSGERHVITQKDLDSIVFFYANGVSTTTTISEIQIELGSTATDYEPYTEQPFSFTPPQPLYSTPDGSVADIVNVQSEQYEYNMSGEVVFDGSTDEAWNLYSAQQGFYINLNDMLKGVRLKGFCDKFQNVQRGNSKRIIFGLNNTRLHVTYVNEYATTVDEWRQWLSENPITVVYPLATPTAQPIPAETLAILRALKSNNGVTNVICNAPVSFQYEQSLQIVIKNIWNAIGQTNANILLNGGNQ